MMGHIVALVGSRPFDRLRVNEWGTGTALWVPL